MPFHPGEPLPHAPGHLAGRRVARDFPVEHGRQVARPQAYVPDKVVGLPRGVGRGQKEVVRPAFGPHPPQPLPVPAEVPVFEGNPFGCFEKYEPIISFHPVPVHFPLVVRHVNAVHGVAGHFNVPRQPEKQHGSDCAQGNE